MRYIMKPNAQTERRPTHEDVGKSRERLLRAVRSSAVFGMARV
jgi:hypothetical protein